MYLNLLKEKIKKRFLIFLLKIPINKKLFLFLEHYISYSKGQGNPFSSLEFEINSCLSLLKKEPNIFIDIGSNLGFYTIVAALQGFQAHAFDISSSCLRGLYHHRTANNVENKVHLHQIGIGDNADIIVTSDSGCDYENYMI